ncbi:MAG: NAD(P)-dependent alcohol dehydrogenase [Rhodospirillales bacterium]
MKAWEIVGEDGIDGLVLNERPLPEPGPGQVLVKVSASSINYRDLSTILDPAARAIPYPRIPNSDCAGTITGLGDGVTDFKQGDRVMGCFFQNWIDGTITPEAMASAMGGALDGVLAEYVVLEQSGIVATPDYLNDEEAATLPCAALTAWNAVGGAHPVQDGDIVLLLGTGGVSVFAQQFSSILGGKTIVTSSSDEKLARIRDLGATETINYANDADWEKTVLEMTDGRGVDRVVEVGGPGTLQKSITAVRVGGKVQLIGVLTGGTGAIQPVDIMRKSVTVRGIYVGSRNLFRQMNETISEHALRPVIDWTAAFADARAPYDKMKSATHFGKIVISLEK